MITLPWIEYQLDRALNGKDDPQNVRDFALLSMARHELLKRNGTPHDIKHEEHHAEHEPVVAAADKVRSAGFNRETAENWVRNMRNVDKAHPVGGKWTADMLKPLAQKYGIPAEGKRFWEFYAMTNAMYSDYAEVARKYGVVSPEFYACMAKAWLEDEDAVPDKTELYYEYIVK